MSWAVKDYKTDKNVAIFVKEDDAIRFADDLNDLVFYIPLSLDGIVKLVENLQK